MLSAIQAQIEMEEYLRMRQKCKAQLERLQKAIDEIAADHRIISKGITSQHPIFNHYVKHHEVEELDRSLLVELVEMYTSVRNNPARKIQA